MPIGHKARLERRKKIAKFVRDHDGNGEPLADAAYKFGVGINTVRTACQENGVKVPTVPRTVEVMAVETLTIVARLCTTGDTLSAIAAVYRVHPQWVSEIYCRCLKAGVPVRKRTRGRGKSR